MNELVFKELEKIRHKSGGVLHPEDVIERAKDKENVLYKYFDWDDNQAAHKYRLEQARHLIRVSVRMLVTDEEPIMIRAFVNLSDERHKDGGYRSTTDVMADRLMRERLLNQAYRELLSLKKKYAELEELAKVFEAIDDVAS